MTISRFSCVLMLLTAVVLLCQTAPSAENSPQAVLGHATAFAAGSASFPASAQQYSLRSANPVQRSVQTAHVAGRGSAAPDSEFSLGYSVLGLGNGFPNYMVGGQPPNPTLAVGSTEVVQSANGTYGDFNKNTGAIILLNGLDFILGNTIWHNLLPGTLCANNNSSQLLVKFDRAAQRWVVTQNVFASPYAVCIAVSQTPTFSDNLWYAYEFPVVQNGFPSYPTWGVWSSGGPSDGYFQTWNNFGPGGSGYVGPVMCGYDRAKLLAGDGTAEQICFQLSVNESSLLPADRDSPVGPPATEDEFFIGSVAAVDNSHLSLYSMHINNWANGDATMTGLNNSQLIAVAPYTGSCNGNYGGDCVPQEGGANRLDSLGDRLMYRLAYWDDRPSASVTSTPPIPPPLQHWLVNFDVESSTGQVGVRWFEFFAGQRTIPVSLLSIFQQGTYSGSPADTNYRWMGSIARDNAQDILLGYSISSSNMYPSIAVAGRKYTDAQGTLSPEQFAVNGMGPGASAWGEYSTMEIDPSDNCTFFYTTEYYMANSSAWSTDLSSWKFPNCR